MNNENVKTVIIFGIEVKSDGRRSCQKQSFKYTLHRSKKESFFMWRGNIQENILYEDSQILVCHKPAGLAVQNAKMGSMDMESALKNYGAASQEGRMLRGLESCTDWISR